MEIGVRLPTRERRIRGEAAADGMKRNDVVDDAAEVPLRIVDVAGLVVAVFGVVRIGAPPGFLAASDEVKACVGKAKMVGTWFAEAGDVVTVFQSWGVRP
jgi:hypothetical protein